MVTSPERDDDVALRRILSGVWRRLLLVALVVVGLLVLAAAVGQMQQPASAAPGAAARRIVAAVLATRQGSDFRYFPHQVGTSRCGIPFVWHRLKGTCSTQVTARRGNSGQILVTFRERWAWRAFHYSGAARRTLHHRWVFDVLPSAKVIFLTQSGDFPPNFAY
jgi:hypothetical protein